VLGFLSGLKAYFQAKSGLIGSRVEKGAKEVPQRCTGLLDGMIHAVVRTLEPGCPVAV
jgi:hypothetical protein